MRCSSSHIVSRRVWLVSIAVSLILAATGSVYAQQAADAETLSLEELLNVKVYSASKYEQKAVEAPSSISVITREEIRKYGYRTIEEALRSLTGFYVQNHGSYSTLGVRGFAPPGDSNGRILYLVNGHAINNNVDDSAPVGNDFPVDMDLVDRIEVVRGPSSSLYGADAFFGVVNVITRMGKSQGTMISGEAGSLGTYKETATYGLDRNGTQALFSATYWDTAAPGHLDSIENPVGSTSAHDQTRRAFAMVASHGFTLQAAASSAEQKAPSSAQWCGSCHQTDTHATNFRGYADLQYDHPVWKGVQLSARTYYDTYESHGKTNDLRGCSEAKCHGPLLDYDTAHGDRVGGDVKLTRRFLDKYRITVGTEYRDNFRQAQSNHATYYSSTYAPTSKAFVNYDRTSAIWGLYGEGEVRFNPRLILNAGVRNDRYNYLFGNTTSPRAALIYTPKKSTTLKFLYGTSYRVPSFSELYYAGMASQPSPGLKPETIRTFEGVWDQRLGQRLTVTAAGFYNHIGSYIQEQTANVGGIDQTSFSNSKASAKGAELELIGKLPSGVEARLSYTYQDARNDVPGAFLPDSPKHLGKLNIAAPLFHRALTPALEAQYMSRSFTQWPSVGYSSTPVLVNVSVFTRPWRGFSVSGGAYNLVGRSMSEKTLGYFEHSPEGAAIDVPSTSLLADDRRSFRVKLTWTSGERGGDKDKSNTHSSVETH
jgi:outer membrane receptor for ferrienterochelin and colicins